MLVRPRPLLTVWYDWVALLAIGALLALLIWLALRARDSFIVPALTGRPLVEVQPKLAQQRVKWKVTERKYSDKPEGEIVGQKPPAGTAFRGFEAQRMREAGVQLIVSRGKQDSFIVPALTGRPLVEVEQELTQKRVRCTVTKKVYSDKPEGQILDQKPPAGTEFLGAAAQRMRKKGVHLTVSRGKQTVELPSDLAGKPAPEVARRLKRAGLKVEVKETNDRNVPEGTVLGMSPKPGAPLAKGETVTLIVSGGIQPGQLVLEPRAGGVYRLRYKPEKGRTHQLWLTWVDLVGGRVVGGVREGKAFLQPGGKEFRRDLRFRGYGWIEINDEGQRADIEINERGKMSPVNGKVKPVNRVNVPWYKE